MISVFRKSYAVEFSLVNLLLVAALLWWITDLRLEDYRLTQFSLVQSAVKKTIDNISDFIAEQRHDLSLFVAHRADLLGELAYAPLDESKQKLLAQEIKLFFPEHLAYILTNAQFTPLLEALKEYRHDLCLQDLKPLAEGQFPRLRIHPNPQAYHFDIASLWEHNQQRGAIVISFPSEILARFLRHEQQPGYRLLLVSNEAAGLIEVTADGARDSLEKANGFKLNEQQKSQIIYTAAINETSWQVVALQQEKFQVFYAQTVENEMQMILILSAILIFSMALLTKRIERKGIQTEQALLASEARYQAMAQNCSHLQITECRQREKILQERETLIKLIFEQLPLGISLLSSTGKFTQANHKFAELCGYSAEEILLCSYIEIVHPSERKRALEQYIALEKGLISAYHLQLCCLRRDQNPFWGELWAAKINDEENNLQSILVILKELSKCEAQK